MKKSKIPFALGLLLVAAGCCSFWAADYPATVEEGFVSLFNGKDLTGWYGSACYGVLPDEPGVLQCLPGNPHGPDERGNLLTEKEYGNFILRFEVLLPENANNGLGIRMPSPDVDAAYFGMCELQLLDDGGSDYYDAATNSDKLKPYQYTGSIYGIVPSRRDNADRQIWGKEKNFARGGSYVRKPGMWNFEEVRVIGSEIEVLLNGYVITRGDVSAFRGDGDTADHRAHPGLHRTRGHLGWLGHGHNVKWRNIRIRELPDDAKMGPCPCAKMACPDGFTALYDGDAEDLAANWKGVTTEGNYDNPIVRAATEPAAAAELQKLADRARDEHWRSRDGALYFDGFKGGYSLATKEDYEDFELWADWRLLSVTGDSGLYLRGAPQVQIWDAHNQWHIGSGGLYNNQRNPSKATAIADRPIGDWNRFHVIMRGERVWVDLNGVRVVDGVTLENYWDRRLPVFFKGPIELQCHGDPVEWRNVFVRPLAPASQIAADRIGVCSWSWSVPLRDVAAAMEKADVKGIHLALGPFIAPDERHGAAEGDAAWAFVKEQVKSGKWKVFSTMVGMVGEDYSTLETIRATGGIVPDGTWAANRRIVTEGARRTAELGCPYMSLHAGFLDEHDPKAYAKYVARVTWLRDEAAKFGVTVILESGQETAEDLAKFMLAVPGLGINFDPANMILYGKGQPVEAVRTLHPWIRQVHVKDALFTAKPGTWGEEVAWGDGAVGARAFVAELERLGYSGNYVIEREAGDRRARDINQAVQRLQ